MTWEEEEGGFGGDGGGREGGGGAAGGEASDFQLAVVSPELEYGAPGAASGRTGCYEWVVQVLTNRMSSVIFVSLGY